MFASVLFLLPKSETFLLIALKRNAAPSACTPPQSNAFLLLPFGNSVAKVTILPLHLPFSAKISAETTKIYKKSKNDLNFSKKYSIMYKNRGL